MKNLLLLLIACLFIIACKNDKSQMTYGNPPSEGFNVEASDSEAIKIADDVMETMGGRQAWDTSRYISWTFFGRRHHTWDKIGGRCRIEMPSDSIIMIIDLNEKTGRVQKNGVEMPADSLAKYVDRGYRMWINDSYWLVMPFKLKDSGVTLKYAGKDTTKIGKNASVLELTFAEVGVTPDNKYLVYVDDETKLVSQWDYFASYQDTVPRFQSPWPDYKKYGDLLLSGGQIAGNQLTNIRVSQSIDEALFSKF